MTPGVPGAPEPRMYPHSAYFLVKNNLKFLKFHGFLRGVFEKVGFWGKFLTLKWKIIFE